MRWRSIQIFILKLIVLLHLRIDILLWIKLVLVSFRYLFNTFDQVSVSLNWSTLSHRPSFLLSNYCVSNASLFWPQIHLLIRDQWMAHQMFLFIKLIRRLGTSVMQLSYVNNTGRLFHLNTCSISFLERPAPLKSCFCSSCWWYYHQALLASSWIRATLFLFHLSLNWLYTTSCKFLKPWFTLA